MIAGRTRRIGAAVAIVLAVVTYLHLGRDSDAALWGLVQVVLVALAVTDIEERRLPNVITLPTAAVALVLRVLFERSHLLEVAVAGAAAYGVFLVLAVALRGGLGMGDVKLAGMLGCLLGSAVVPALAAGVFAGGLWALGLIVARRATMRTSIAYGQFLAFGGVVAILFASPPPLV